MCVANIIDMFLFQKCETFTSMFEDWGRQCASLWGTGVCADHDKLGETPVLNFNCASRIQKLHWLEISRGTRSIGNICAVVQGNLLIRLKESETRVIGVLDTRGSIDAQPKKMEPQNERDGSRSKTWKFKGDWCPKVMAAKGALLKHTRALKNLAHLFFFSPLLFHPGRKLINWCHPQESGPSLLSLLAFMPVIPGNVPRIHQNVLC